MALNNHAALVQDVAAAFHILTDPQALHLHILRNQTLSEGQLLHLLGDGYGKKSDVRAKAFEEIEAMVKDRLKVWELRPNGNVDHALDGEFEWFLEQLNKLKEGK